MKGIVFNGKHSNRDYNLNLINVDIEPPKPIIHTVKIPGMDGELDITEALGAVNYNNRSFKAVFDFYELDEFLKNKKLSIIQNELNGVKCKIMLDNDPEFYYIGRISLKVDKANAAYYKVTIESKLEPYKYKKNKTIIQKTISKANTVVLPNLKKPAIPKITSNASLNLTFKNSTFGIQAGESIIPEFKLGQGDNEVTVKGNGTITFEYQEGGF